MSTPNELDTAKIIRDVLLDPKDGLSARLLVVEAEQRAMNGKLDATLFALNGDSRTKGLITLFRELEGRQQVRDTRKQWLARDVFTQGLLIGGVLLLGQFLLMKYGGS